MTFVSLLNGGRQQPKDRCSQVYHRIPTFADRSSLPSYLKVLKLGTHGV
jgi:hypothetical protein